MIQPPTAAAGDMTQICTVQDEFGFVLDDNGFGGWHIGTMEQVAMRAGASVSSVPPTICHLPFNSSKHFSILPSS